ncbi:ribosome hibernation-promoting factor, HPF/YfiA family [Pokkaliibacter plantistimulans]
MFFNSSLAQQFDAHRRQTMQIRISNLDDAKLSPAVRERLIQKLVQHSGLDQQVHDLHIVMNKSGRKECIEAHIHLSDQGDFFAKAEGDNLYVAIDELGDKVRKQVERYRARFQPRRGAGMKRAAEATVS